MLEDSNRILLVDAKYRFILGVIQLTKTANEFVTPIQLESVSPISNLPVLKYNFDDYINDFSNNPYYIRGLKSPSSYIFTEDNEFKVRPRILTYLLNGNPERLKLSTQYTCCIEYFDPDNVNYLNDFKYVKFKDRYGFLNIHKKLFLDNSSKAFVKFKSNFPGVCKFRSKDSSYICTMSVLQCRFMQEVTENEI
jgi:hypothetical protein